MLKNTVTSPDINDEYQQRLAKLAELKSKNIEAFPSQAIKNISIADFLADFKKHLASEKPVILAGRLVSIRMQGGSCFVHLVDSSAKVQAFLRKDTMGEELYDNFKNYIDQADFVEFSGQAFLTKTNEPTILVKDFTLLTKTLLPMPDQYYGLKDPDLRYRKRYLDLLVNPNIKQIFNLRNQLIKLTRQWFDKYEFLEVDTPVLQTVAGGAAAEPFVTHHNSLDIDLYLRVAPELYLKRLIIGGFERVYEIARCFRNEGMDHQHNPEFTQIEAYWAYQDYQGLMVFIEKFFTWLVPQINNQDLVLINGDDKLDFKAPFKRLDFKEALDAAMSVDTDACSDEELFNLGKKANIALDKAWGRGKLLDELYKKFVRKNIIQPTFIINHPLALSPLAKKIKDRPNYVERFQLVIKGAEVVNAFSELNDPIDQEARFKEQSKLKDKGDDEAMSADADFVEALKHGLPPTAGLGMGIDRLLMILGNNENIKEVILFPTVKPKKD